jgi:hypothetical protein
MAATFVRVWLLHLLAADCQCRAPSSSRLRVELLTRHEPLSGCIGLRVLVAGSTSEVWVRVTKHTRQQQYHRPRVKVQVTLVIKKF